MRAGALFLLLLFLFSCGEKEPSFPRADHTIHLDGADEELARIGEDARNTLALFIRHLNRPRRGEGNFRIKVPFPASASSGFNREQLWLGDITFKNGTYYGRVLNTPFYVTDLSRGDLVPFSMDDITDWMFTCRGKIAGGRSIKYLLELIPPAERDREQQAMLALFDQVPLRSLGGSE
jgi:uncharacterized protein YegJ (DUF2314 family)